MSMQHLFDAAAYTAISCSAWFSGAALYVNCTQMPALLTIKDTDVVRQQLMKSIKRVTIFQDVFVLLGTIGAAVVVYLDESWFRWMWLAAAMSLFSVFPWTLIVMLPDMMELNDDDVISKKGESWVRYKIHVWNRLHIFRTFISTVAFILMVTALCEQKLF